MSSKEYCKVSPILYLDDLYIVRCIMQTRRDSLTHIFIFLYLERIWQRIIVDVWAFSYIRKYHTKTLHVLHLRERLQCYALTVFYPSFLVIEFLSLFWGVMHWYTIWKFRIRFSYKVYMVKRVYMFVLCWYFSSLI